MHICICMWESILYIRQQGKSMRTNWMCQPALIDELMQLSCNELSDRTSIKALIHTRHSSFVTLSETIHFKYAHSSHRSDGRCDCWLDKNIQVSTRLEYKCYNRIQSIPYSRRNECNQIYACMHLLHFLKYVLPKLKPFAALVHCNWICTKMLISHTKTA